MPTAPLHLSHFPLVPSLLSAGQGGGHRQQYVSAAATAALLPISRMAKAVTPAPVMAAASRLVESAMASISGCPAAAVTSFADALVSELYQHNTEINALV